MVKGENTAPGVMDASYNADRRSKPQLVYRYKVRGQIAADGFREHHPKLSHPSVLEMGAADGLTLLYIRELLGGEGEYVGVEYAQSLIENAPPLPRNVSLVKGDVTALPEEVPAGHYDLVSCLAVLEHLENPQAAVEEAFRILKPGGVFVATCPNPFWDEVATKFGLLPKELHQVEVTGRLLVEYCKRAGFTEAVFRPFMWVVTGFLPYLRIPVSPTLSRRVDRLVRKVGLMDFSFVNQAVVAQKS